jgi:hypothetical protein
MDGIGRKLAAATAVVVALAIAVPAGATAPGHHAGTRGDGIYHCLLKASKLGADLTLTYTLDSGVAGRTWHVKMWDNKKLVYSKDRITNAAGNFKAVAETENLHGPDNIVARAQNQTTGQVCKIELKV